MSDTPRTKEVQDWLVKWLAAWPVGEKWELLEAGKRARAELEGIVAAARARGRAEGIEEAAKLFDFSYPNSRFGGYEREKAGLPPLTFAAAIRALSGAGQGYQFQDNDGHEDSGAGDGNP